ncbi:MAG: DUF1622 domain-containing protein [Chloroflexota bacterium]
MIQEIGSLAFVSFLIGSVGIAVVVWGVLVGFAEFVVAEFVSLKPGGKKELPLVRIRRDIGLHLLLGVEFLAVAEIIRALASPSLSEIAALGIVVVVRTIINHYLSMELRQYEDRSG